MKRIPLLFALLLSLALLSACETMNQIAQVGAEAAAQGGLISTEQAQSIQKSSTAMAKAAETITPSQEYYIGRAVAANLMTTYRPYPDARANRYLNQIGQTLAIASLQPETFGGYHFQIVDSDEVNAFAAPGGLILVSRGLLRCCPTEDAVAAVLAHEIAHVQYRHGIGTIKQSRLTGALTTLATEGAKNLGDAQLAEVTRAFEGSISDVTNTLMVGGYSRAAETQADAGAVAILQGIGYNPMGLQDMLAEMSRRFRSAPTAAGFAKTHPDPADRLADLAPLLRGLPRVQPQAARDARFRAALAGI